MQFFKDREAAEWNAYWGYLESIKAQLPAHMAAFACDPTNYDLTSPQSLHDSWLESWNVKEISEPDHRKARKIQIECRLLGSRWDRVICLTYRDVKGHEIEAVEQPASRGHGDLLVHEFRIVRAGLFAHELLFESGTRLLVEFTDFEYGIEKLQSP